MKVLVTGGAGFIGSHTCLALLQRGYEVVVIDSFINSNRKSLHAVIKIVESLKKNDELNLKIIESDIRDENILDKLFLESQLSGKPFQAVIHFAGLKAVKDSILNPLLYWDVNLNGSIKLLKVMNKYECCKIVFSSSATVYGLSDLKPINEKSDLKPINPYGQTKAAIEILLNDIYQSNPNSWKIANLRYFNPIGAHSSGLIGEAPIGIPNNIFPYITQVAAGKREKLTVFGNDWATKDGTGVRDYIHVMDLAEGHISALEYLVKNDNQIISLNLGTGLGTSVLELIETFEKVNNIEIPLEFAKRRVGDCSSLIADNSLVSSCLDWSPKRDLKTMCKDGWKWQCLNPEGYR
tara:strand:- start:2405 stop:3457 length:1053 start_codon:yes stop_codon:yes gene_type:complete